MRTEEKIQILAEAARYDASCASSGSTRSGRAGGLGNTAASGICHSWAADGRCISLLKLLLSNDCVYDCAYCHCRRSNDLPRASFSAEEVAELTINFYTRNYIEGLFLSSAVCGNADRTMAEMVAVCQLLRQKHRFDGYIHLKVIPGSSPELVHQAGLLADRLSVNIELPSEQSLRLLAPQKSKRAILLPMNQIGEEAAGYGADRKRSTRAPVFCPAGQSTQMIIGASPESDLHILHLSENLYRRVRLRRVYYSAYTPVNDVPNLPALNTTPPLVREHRLYQADWLMRFYRFEAREILPETQPFLDQRLDPKAAWALRHIDSFPLDVNRASYEELLRVPGLGPVSAQRIIATRRITHLRLQDLRKIGLVMRRARHFLRIGDTYLGDPTLSHERLATMLQGAEDRRLARQLAESRQLRLF